MGAGVYLPAGVSESIGELLLCVDTSGSICDATLNRMLGVVSGLLDTVNVERVRLLYWDAQVCRSEVYERHQYDTLVSSTKPAGGGGTRVACVNEWMAEHNVTPQVAVVITDGYLGGEWGSWTCPVLWVIVNNKNTYAPFGKTLHVSD
jgi:predicted metal-dependent peptidase